MNRYRKILHIVILVSVLLAGCSQPPPEPTPKPTRIPTPAPVTEPTEEPEDMPADTEVFYNLDDFNAYLAVAKEGGDLADLADLERYFLPTGLPEDYVLYKITAGVVDIGFWYASEKDLTSQTDFHGIESTLRYFLFVSGRGRNSLAAIIEKDGASSKDLIDGRYYEPPRAPGMLYWEEDGELIYMYLPAGCDRSDLSALCATECYERGEDGTFTLAP